MKAIAFPSGDQTGSRSAAKFRVSLVCSVPCRCSGGSYSVEEGLEVGEFAQAKLDITVNELKEERDAVKQLGLI